MITVQGSGSASQGEVSFLSWNSKVQHILASTSYNGTTGEEGIKFNLYIWFFLLYCLVSDGYIYFNFGFILQWSGT